MATKRVTVLIPRLRWMSFWNVEELSMNAEGVRKFSMCQFGGLMLYCTLMFEYFSKMKLDVTMQVLFFPRGKNLVG